MSSCIESINAAVLAVYPDTSPQDIQANKSPSQAIHWAVDATPTAIQDMGVNHGRADIPVPEKLLDCPNIIAILKQVRGK